MSYMDHFLSLNCADDVLKAVTPLNNGTKEISEAMALVRAVRPKILKRPKEYSVLDLCAGNALTSIIIAHLLPIKKVFAIDTKVPNRHHEVVKNFEYMKMDIFDKTWTSNKADEPTIIVSSHPCTKLASRIIEIYKANDCIKMLAMLPCCVNREELDRAKLSPVIREKLGTYLSWCHYLAEKAGGKLIEDRHCLSKCNGLIIAEKNSNHVGGLNL